MTVKSLTAEKRKRQKKKAEEDYAKVREFMCAESMKFLDRVIGKGVIRFEAVYATKVGQIRLIIVRESEIQ